MYNLVSIDMDGTLLDSNHNLTLGTIKTLKRLQDKKVIVLINTGRTYSEMSRYIDELNFIHYFSLANGSLIFDNRNKNFIKVKRLSNEIILKAQEIASEFNRNVMLVFSCDKETYADNVYIGGIGAKQHEAVCGKEGVKFINDSNNILLNSYVSKGVIFGERKSLENIKERLEKFFGDKIKLLFSLYNALEVLSSDMDKVNSIKIIQNIFDIKTDEIIGIGDSYNDINMIEYSGLGVAMGNSVEVLKKIADEIIESNNNEGVANFLKMEFGI